MGVRSSVALTLQIGEDNSLTSGNLVGDVDLADLTDTLSKGGTITGVLEAGVINLQVAEGNIRLMYVEADGDLDVYFGGDPATVARIAADSGTYPTGFVGGETLVVNIDNTVVTVTFSDTDQSLTQVLSRINAAAALAGLSGFIASADDDTDDVAITSLTSGDLSIVAIAGGTDFATLGFAVGSDVGLNPIPATAPVPLRRLADPESSQISTMKSYALLSVLANSVFISNPSDTEDVQYKIVVAGDMVVDCTC